MYNVARVAGMCVKSLQYLHNILKVAKRCYRLGVDFREEGGKIRALQKLQCACDVAEEKRQEELEAKQCDDENFDFSPQTREERKEALLKFGMESPNGHGADNDSDAP